MPELLVRRPSKVWCIEQAVEVEIVEVSLVNKVTNKREVCVFVFSEGGGRIAALISCSPSSWYYTQGGGHCMSKQQGWNVNWSPCHQPRGPRRNI